MKFLCSQKEYAKLIGVSPAAIWYQRNLGVAFSFNGKILLRDSLEVYLESYLPPNQRNRKIAEIVARLTVTITSTDTGLFLVRNARKNLAAAKDNLCLLKMLMRLTRTNLTAAINTAQNQVATFKTAFDASKVNVTNFIEQLHLDALTESILIYRYVDLMTWYEISELTRYSQQRLFQLHRAGLTKTSRRGVSA